MPDAPPSRLKVEVDMKYGKNMVNGCKAETPSGASADRYRTDEAYQVAPGASNEGSRTMNKTVHKVGCKLSGQVLGPDAYRPGDVGIAFEIPTGSTKQIGRPGEEKDVPIKSRQRLWVSEEDAEQLFVSLARVFVADWSLERRRPE